VSLIILFKLKEIDFVNFSYKGNQENLKGGVIQALEVLETIKEARKKQDSNIMKQEKVDTFNKDEKIEEEIVEKSEKASHTTNTTNNGSSNLNSNYSTIQEDKEKKSYVNKKPINIIPINRTDIKSAKSNSPVSKQQNIKEISINTYNSIMDKKNLSPQAIHNTNSKFSNKNLGTTNIQVKQGINKK